MKFFIDVWTASDDSLPEVIMLRNMAAYRFQNSLLSENQINDVQEWVGEQFSRLLLEEKTTLSMRSDITIINFDDCAPEGRLLAFFSGKAMTLSTSLESRLSKSPSTSPSLTKSMSHEDHYHRGI